MPHRLGEDDLIAKCFRPLATDPAALALRDDCAALPPPPGCDLVLKTDAVAAGIHFFPDDPWDLVAKKALRVNLSDLAAKGARPLGYLLSLALPADWREADLAAFARGLAADQAEFGLSLLGGDTIRSPAGLVVTITVLGAVPTGRMPRRTDARPGDRLFVSGTLGDAALGLALRTGPERFVALDETARAHLADRYLLPRPRAALAPAVLAHARAAMDLSDGLGLDLARLCTASGCAAEIDLARLPLSPPARTALAARPDLIEIVVAGGDDYEILAAVPPEAVADFTAAAAVAGVPVAAVGRMIAVDGEGRGGVSWRDSTGAEIPLAFGGFCHF